MTAGVYIVLFYIEIDGPREEGGEEREERTRHGKYIYINAIR